MSTKRFEIMYQKEIDGDPTGITGATVQLRLIRCSDSYEWDSLTELWASSAATPVTMTESGTIDGYYSKSMTISAWSNGSYFAVINARKAGESPYTITESFTVASGTASTSGTISPAPANMARVYLYLADIPSTIPTISFKYLGAYSSSGTVYFTPPTPVYDNSTGLLYADLAYSSTVSIDCLSRGIHKTVFIPPISTVSITSLSEVR